MRPKFNLRVENRYKIKKPKNAAEAAAKQSIAVERLEQIDEAVEWCRQHGKRGHAALSTGKYPLIRSRIVIDKRLDGAVVSGKEKKHLTILTQEEESTIVQYVCNKNRAYQGMNRKRLTELIIDVLKIRDHANKKMRRGRKYVALTDNAKRALANKRLSKSFWRRWDANHADIRLKRQGVISMNRALNCTREMACSHLDELAGELQACGIMTDAKMIKAGIWTAGIDLSCIFNHDETPQFVNYGVDGSASGLVYGGRGENCQKLIRQNRECVTIHPMVSLSGDKCICHVIFGAQGITSQMAPKEAVKNINNLLISTTENGSQDHKSLYAFYQLFDRYLTEKNVRRPVVVLSDGHSSRFDYEVLRFLHEKQIHLFVSPPDTTGVTQLLDQINKTLHEQYENAKSDLFTQMQTINREAFMVILANTWDKWATKESIRNAGRKVGIAENGLNVEMMQTEKFEKALQLIEQGEKGQVCEVSSSTLSPTSLNESDVSSLLSQQLTSPVSSRRKDSQMYWKEKAASWKNNCVSLQKMIGELHEKSIDLNQIPGLLTIQKVKPSHSTPKVNTRVTQVHGSMEGKDVLKVVQGINAAKEEKMKEKEAKESLKRENEEAFYRCKEQCNCNDEECKAAKLKQCPVCHTVMRSTCSKSKCMVDGKRPTMLLPSKASKKVKNCKQLFPEVYSSESEDESSEFSESEEEEEEDDDLGDLIKELHNTWANLSPPNPEPSGQWFAVEYLGKRRGQLLIAKLLNRFLVDEDGPVEKLRMRCLKPKVGSGNILQDTPKHLPDDVWDFELKDVVAGPLNVEPKGGTQFTVHNYEEIAEFYRKISQIKWKSSQ